MKISRLALATAVALASTGVALAEWPNDHPIRMIVAFAPGGSTDVMARALEPYLEAELGAEIVIENLPGASGEIAYTELAKSAPDGYTFSYINTPGFLSMQVQRELSYDPASIKPIARLVDDPAALVVPEDSPFQTISDFVEAAKANPGSISFGSSGVGTDDHLSIILLGREAGAEFTHIPFGGSAETRTALLGSQISSGGLNVSEFASSDNAGLRMLAVFGSTRSSDLPDVPTAREAGFNVDISSERGIGAPRDLPQDISDRFSAAVEAVLGDPDFIKQAEDMALPIAYLNGAQWEAQMPSRLGDFQAIWDTTPWVTQ